MIRKYPSLFLLLFVLGGIVSADLLQWPAWVFLLGALLCCLGGLLLFSAGLRTYAIVGLGGGLGMAAAVHFALSFYDFGARHLAAYVGEDRICQVFGRVSDWPDLKTNLTEVKIAVDSLGGDISRAVEGSILLKVADTTTALQIGDRIELYARMYPLQTERGSSSGYDYSRYLRLKGVYGVVYLPTLLDVRIDKRYPYGVLAGADYIRQAIASSLRTNLSPTAAALASGFLIGETRDIPSDIYQMFRQSGTLHLLAVSGSNVALVLLVINYLLRPFGLSRRKRAIFLMIVLLLFTMISYGQPSVIRAAVMAGLVIVAGLLKRRYDLNNVIALSMLIILLLDPGELYDVGFQLSYATAWGLIFIVPKLTDLFEKYQTTRWYRWFAFPVIISLVAQLCSTPLMLFYFGQAPLLSIVANLVIVPLTSVAVVVEMVVLIADLVWPMLGLLCGAVLTAFLHFEITLVRWFGSDLFPSLRLGHTMDALPAALAMMAFYGLIVLATFAITRRSARRGLIVTTVVLANIGLLWAAIPSRSTGTDQLRLITVPGGIAAVRFRDGASSGDLIVTGLKAKEYSIGERILCPWLRRLGVSRINRCFVLSAEYHALREIAVLTDSLEVDSFYLPSSLRQAATDAFDESGKSSLLTFTQFYAMALPETGSGGYSPCRGGLYVRVNSVRLLLVPECSDLSGVHGDPKQSVTLIGGGTWRTRVDCDSLKALGLRRVFCSKVEQRVTGTSHREPDRPDERTRDCLIDLGARGEISLLLADTLILRL